MEDEAEKALAYQEMWTEMYADQMRLQTKITEMINAHQAKYAVRLTNIKVMALHEEITYGNPIIFFAKFVGEYTDIIIKNTKFANLFPSAMESIQGINANISVEYQPPFHKSLKEKNGGNG